MEFYNNFETETEAITNDTVVPEAFRQYSISINQYQLLSKEEEIELAKQIEKGNMYAREQFINANLRLVVNIAREYTSLDCDMSDIIQNGNIGLMKAVDKFDYRKGYKFSTYAVPWIRKYILKGFNNQARLIRLPEQVCDDLTRLNKVVNQLISTLDREPTSSEIADKLGSGFTKDKVELLLKDKEALLSLDLRVGRDEDDKAITLSNFVPDMSQDTVKLYERQESLNMINAIVNNLPEDERLIIRLYYGFEGDKYSFKSIAAKLNISTETARLIHKRTLIKLKASFIEAGLNIDLDNIAG